MNIIIPGIPLPQARLRQFTRGKRNILYDPQGRDKVLIKRYISALIKANFEEYKFPENPQISIVFYMPIPKFMPKYLRVYADKEMLKHTCKPDSDNLIKLYFDCLNEIAIEDDARVSIGAVIKIYSPNPRTFINIEATEKVLMQPLEETLPFLTGDVLRIETTEPQHDAGLLLC